MLKNRNENGFTLVEVLASIVIISIILLGVSQLMNFTSKAAETNKTKLVTTHLAKASIERIKIKPEDYFQFSANDAAGKTYTRANCQGNDCSVYEFDVNDQTYDVEVKVSQSDTKNEKELGLIKVLVKVELRDKYINSQVEGYVSDALFKK